MTKGDKEKILRFERLIIRKIHGSIYNQDKKKWEIRSNNQLSTLYNRKNLVQLRYDCMRILNFKLQIHDQFTP